MERTASEAGRVLRAKSSFAPRCGPLGLPNGGSGFGSTLPLSCAETGLARIAKTIEEIPRRAFTLRSNVTPRIFRNRATVGQKLSATASVSWAGQLEVASKGRLISGNGAAHPRGSQIRKPKVRTGWR